MVIPKHEKKFIEKLEGNTSHQRSAEGLKVSIKNYRSICRKKTPEQILGENHQALKKYRAAMHICLEKELSTQRITTVRQTLGALHDALVKATGEQGWRDKW